MTLFLQLFYTKKSCVGTFNTKTPFIQSKTTKNNVFDCETLFLKMNTVDGHRNCQKIYITKKAKEVSFVVFYHHILAVRDRWKLLRTNLDAVDDVGVGVWVHMDPPFSGSGEIRAAAMRTQLWIFRFFTILYTLWRNGQGCVAAMRVSISFLQIYRQTKISQEFFVDIFMFWRAGYSLRRSYNF
jgi:hypothetical protein